MDVTTIALCVVIVIFGFAYLSRNERSQVRYKEGYESGKNALNEDVKRELSYIGDQLRNQNEYLSNSEDSLQEAFFCGVEYAVLYSYTHNASCHSPDDVSELIDEIMSDTNEGTYDKSLHHLKVIKMFDEIEDGE